MENIKIKKFIGLKSKITLNIIIYSLVILSIVFTALYINSKRIIREDLNLRLLNEVNIAVLQINAQKHSTLKTVLDEETDAYKDIKLVLQKIRNNSTDIYYIYTLRENENNEIEFIVDAEESEEDISHLSDVYEDAGSFLKDNFLSINSPVVEKDFSTDQWGTWISAFAPFYDEYGNREGVLGIDVQASDVVSKESDLLKLYLLLFILSGLFSAILGFGLSKRLLKSITYLTNIFENNDKNINIESAMVGRDEIGALAVALKKKFSEVEKDKSEADIRYIDKNKTLEKMNELMVGRELEMIKLKKEINELKKGKE